MDPLPQTRPLWEIHIIKYPTSNASGSLVFKLHHALGDGFSLMGALLSCLQRADNPSLPLTFPNFQKSSKADNELKSLINALPKALTGALNTVLDFGWSILKSSFLEDSRTPIRSGKDGVEFQPINIMTMTFSLDKIKQIKSNLHVVSIYILFNRFQAILVSKYKVGCPMFHSNVKTNARDLLIIGPVETCFI